MRRTSSVLLCVLAGVLGACSNTKLEDAAAPPTSRSDASDDEAAPPTPKADAGEVGASPVGPI